MQKKGKIGLRGLLLAMLSVGFYSSAVVKESWK